MKGVAEQVNFQRRYYNEMLRVAKKAIFMSDGNNMGQGRLFVRKIKHALRACGLWNLAYLVRSRGKGYWTSENDGLAYPFSVFDHYGTIRAHCEAVHIINTRDAGMSLYHSAPEVALLGIKKDLGNDVIEAR